MSAMASTHLAFVALELKHSWGLDVISNLTKTLFLWSTDPRLCSSDDLIQVRTLYGSHMRLFSGFLVPPLKGANNVPEDERSGQGLNCMTSDVWGEERSPLGEVPPYNSLVPGPWGFQPWRHSTPDLLFLFCSRLSASYSLHLSAPVLDWIPFQTSLFTYII